MSLERRYVDILTMGRSGIDVFPLQIGAHLEDVETFGKFLGGSPTNVAVAAAAGGLTALCLLRWRRVRPALGDVHDAALLDVVARSFGAHVSL